MEYVKYRKAINALLAENGTLKEKLEAQRTTLERNRLDLLTLSWMMREDFGEITGDREKLRATMEALRRLTPSFRPRSRVALVANALWVGDEVAGPDLWTSDDDERLLGVMNRVRLSGKPAQLDEEITHRFQPDEILERAKWLAHLHDEDIDWSAWKGKVVCKAPGCSWRGGTEEALAKHHLRVKHRRRSQRIHARHP